MNELERCFEVGDDGRMIFNKGKNNFDADFGLSHKPQQTTNKRKLNKELGNKSIFDDCITVK